MQRKKKSTESGTRREARRAELGAIYTFQVLDGRFGACQVVSTAPSEKSIEIVPLDFLVSRRPTVEDVAHLKFFRRTWGNWNGEIARCKVDERVPWWAERITLTEPLEKHNNERCLSGHWLSAFEAYYKQRWEGGARRIWKLDTTQVNVDLGGGVRKTRRDASRVIIGPDGMYPAPMKGRVKFDALDNLPYLTGISYTGRDGTFLDYVVSRKIPTVRWMDHGQQTIDLRESRVEELSLTVGDEPVTLKTPETLERLMVSGHVEKLTVEGVRLDFPFSLQLYGPRITRPPRGAETVQKVHHMGLTDTDASALSSYSRLAELTLQGAPGKLQNASVLAFLKSLRELTILELYDLDGSNWPSDWPLLDGVTIHGLRKADAEVIKIALTTVPDVRITGARSEDWIEANLENPFREWEEDDAAFGHAACAAWRKARIQTTKLSSRAKKEDAEKLLKDLVTALNKLNRKHDIDTIRRDEAGNAFFALARELGIDDEQASSWFDAWRDF